MTRLINFFNQLFGSKKTRMAARCEKEARHTSDAFSKMNNVVYNGQPTIKEKRKADADRQQFLNDNKDLEVDQNVERNSNNKRARKLLIWTFAFESILSFKGTQFLLGQFVGVTQWYLILLIGMVFAGFAIYGSITVNHFSENYQNNDYSKYLFLKIASYALIFIIPCANILEAIVAGVSNPELALNLILVVITLGFHASLITMSDLFIDAENSKKAIEKLEQLEEECRKADRKVEALQSRFIKARKIFASKAKKFVPAFKKLHKEHSEATEWILYQCDNFMIWSINNKIYHHKVLPYHTNDEGKLEIEREYFVSEKNTVVDVWDHLSSVEIDNTNGKRNSVQGSATTSDQTNSEDSDGGEQEIYNLAQFSTQSENGTQEGSSDNENFTFSDDDKFL